MCREHTASVKVVNDGLGLMKENIVLSAKSFFWSFENVPYMGAILLPSTWLVTTHTARNTTPGSEEEEKVYD